MCKPDSNYFIDSPIPHTLHIHERRKYKSSSTEEWQKRNKRMTNLINQKARKEWMKRLCKEVRGNFSEGKTEAVH
jgi:hypothetical protein